MEIDFLGLNNSSKYNMEQQSSKAASTDSANGEVETSLSLSTCSSIGCQREILNFCEKKKQRWEFPYKQEGGPNMEQPGLVLVPTPVFQPCSTTAFLYDLNDRSISQLAAEPPASLAMLYSARPNVFNDNLQEKSDSSLYVAGNASTGLADNTRICPRGYTPTVAMARRATLARFLEKRLHRMKQAKASHLMRTSSVSGTYSEVCNTTISRSNKKRNKSLITP